MFYPYLDKHIQDGFNNQVVIICDSIVTQTSRKLTYFEVKTEVVKLASRMPFLELKKGDIALI